ncbi:MAG: DNA repair protein RadC [Candidatus Pedobacter colombiensis]|uniref:DNA repair protein RadC n=1 Tax=Candidatus Pedobacter colombiensis TaxID=3121371 RepID=A0AAJ5W7M9_9SPHI|nr:DNA repair protein RadC [Pedobacter sp.]WEK20063.1 MAG: DNA repair protein RadC [Pedobacter sp.]
MNRYQEKIGIKMWAEADRPREKLLLNGRRYLTDAELIAILIGSGNKDETAVDLSKRILGFYNNDLDALGKVSVKDLSKFKGIGEAKAVAIVAALELGRRRKETASRNLVKIVTSADAFAVLLPVFADLNHEEFWILILNQANYLIGKQLISKGGMAGTVADPKIIFKTALEHNAAYVILAHNHPSGSLKPSQQDINITKKMVEAGRVLDLHVLDHLIVTDKVFFSFGDEGLI